MNAAEMVIAIKQALAFDGHSIGRREMEVAGIIQRHTNAIQRQARNEAAPDLLKALKQCKAAVENQNLPPSARMELVRDYATPAMARAEGGEA